MKIKDYADLFALDGQWRKKRAEKKIFFTDKSLVTRNGMMQNYVVPLWGEINPKRLTVKTIDKSMEGITSTLTGRPLAGATRNRILSVLSEMYVYLIGEDKVKNNPVRDVERCPSYPETPRDALPEAEMRKLFPKTHNELKKLYISQKYICAFLILKDTGLRPGELIALKWSDWHSDIKFFPILKAIESGTRTKVKGTKTGATKPAIISEQTAAEIEALRRKVKPSPEQYIFANCKGIPYDTHRLSWAFHRAVKLAGIDRPELTPYWLRHTFNTIMLETLEDKTVSHLMGHDTAGMRQRYRHAGVDSLRREAVKISADVNGARLF
jgi:integrase